MEASTNVIWSTFVVRLRRETTEGEWRGQIVHLQSQMQRNFSNLAEVREFLCQHAPGLDKARASILENSDPPKGEQADSVR